MARRANQKLTPTYTIYVTPSVSWAAVVVVMAAPAAALSQAAPLPPRQAESSEGFTRISGLRELRDGRVVVSDGAEQRVVVLSADLRQGDALGRVGRGPREYVNPDAVLPWLGDSSLIVDPGASRVLVLDPAGTIVGERSATVEMRGFAFAPSFRAADAHGWLYYLGIPARVRGVASDTAPLIRTRLDRVAADTVAWVRRPVAPTASQQQGGQVTFRRARPDPFAVRDAWGVASDGSVAVVRGGDYRVEWFRDGRRVAQGPVIRVNRITVTQADLDQLEDQRAVAARTTSSFGTGGGTLPNRGSAPSIQDAEVSREKPPFLANNASVDPRGRVWVPRTRAAGDSIPLYDVFDERGTLVLQIALPPNSELVGFGRTAVYVSRADQDDIFRLGRHPLP